MFYTFAVGGAADSSRVPPPSPVFIYTGLPWTNNGRGSGVVSATFRAIQLTVISLPVVISYPSFLQKHSHKGLHVQWIN